MPKGGIFKSKNEAVALRILEDFRSDLKSRRQAAQQSQKAVSTALGAPHKIAWCLN